MLAVRTLNNAVPAVIVHAESTDLLIYSVAKALTVGRPNATSCQESLLGFIGFPTCEELPQRGYRVQDVNSKCCGYTGLSSCI